MNLTNRAVAFFLACTLGVASGAPVLGTIMRCGPAAAMAGGMGPSSMGGDEPVCASCSDVPGDPGAPALTAGTCCRLSTVDQTDALSATLAASRSGPSDDGRALVAAPVPSPAALETAALAATRSSTGSPPTVSPPTPARTTILRN